MNKTQFKAKKLRKAWREQRKAVQKFDDRHYHTYGAHLKREEARERRMAHVR